jgi:hypothetical protein
MELDLSAWTFNALRGYNENKIKKKRVKRYLEDIDLKNNRLVARI